MFSSLYVCYGDDTEIGADTNRQGLPGAMQDWGLYDQGFGYNVVAVFGSQSTGKSAFCSLTQLSGKAAQEQGPAGVRHARATSDPLFCLESPEWQRSERLWSLILYGMAGTLLNALFGTPFDVMNESQRQQTTKGIWMAKGKKMPVLVMDVEGTGAS